MVIFRFRELPWYSCRSILVLVFLVNTNLSSFTYLFFSFQKKVCIFQPAKLLTLEDKEEGPTYAERMHFIFQFNYECCEGGA